MPSNVHIEKKRYFGKSQQDDCEDIVNLKSEFAFSIRFTTKSNECSRPTINMMLSHFADPNECICRLTFLFEVASLFVIIFIVTTAFIV